MFGDVAGGGKVQEVAGSTRFRANTAHAKAAKRLALHHGAGTPPVEIELAYAQALCCLLKVAGTARVDSTREGKLAICRKRLLLAAALAASPVPCGCLPQRLAARRSAAMRGVGRRLRIG
jgi:hypothetical protein